MAVTRTSKNWNSRTATRPFLAFFMVFALMLVTFAHSYAQGTDGDDAESVNPCMHMEAGADMSHSMPDHEPEQGNCNMQACAYCSPLPGELRSVEIRLLTFGYDMRFLRGRSWLADHPDHPPKPVA